MIDFEREIAENNRAELAFAPPYPALTTTDHGAIEMAIPTQARVREYFNYDPETGVLRFKERRADEFTPALYALHLKRVGQQAGSPNNDGYIKVVFNGTVHSAHRLIWLLAFGEWVAYPNFEIDHINGDRADNRLANLRKVTKSDNQRNAGKRANNTSGIHGVNWKPRNDGHAGGWVARIWNGPRHVYLGQFKTLHEAAIARKAAERALGYTGTDREHRDHKAHALVKRGLK